MQGIDIRLRWSCPRANGGGDAYRDEDAHFARRQAFGLDDIDSSTHYVEHAAKTLFLMWVTLTEHKWVTLGERRGSRGAGISWPLRRSEARRSSTWHSVPTATGRGLGWSWWWRRTYALNSGVARKSIACRSCHHQGLKPHSFHGSARLKPCPDTNQIITSCSRKCRNSCRRASARRLATRQERRPESRTPHWHALPGQSQLSLDGQRNFQARGAGSRLAAAHEDAVGAWRHHAGSGFVDATQVAWI